MPITRHRVLLLMVVLALVAGTLGLPGRSARPVQAGGSWSAWLYDNLTGRLVHVFPDGAAAQELTLPLPPDVTEPPNWVSISNDGALLVTCLYTTSQQISVRVFDIYAYTWRAAYTSTGSGECALAHYPFTPDNKWVVASLFYHYPGASDPRPEWEMIIMDVNSGALFRKLDSNSPELATVPIDFSGKMPRLSIVDAHVLAFAPVLWGTEGMPEYDSVVWQWAGDGTLNVVGPYGKAGLDFHLPNGEAIWLEERDEFPKGYLEGPGILFNTVWYSNKSGDLYPIFSYGASVLYNAAFVDGGRKIAVQVYTPPNPEQWMVFDRAGNVTPLPTVDGWDLWGTRDGYFFLTLYTGQNVQQAKYHRFTGGSLPEEFVLWTAAPNEMWQIVWVNPMSEQAGLPPFPAISPAQAPVPDNDETAPLTIGQRVQVHTTEGDYLRIRTGPNTSYPVSFQLSNGTPVTLLEGPNNDGTFMWWRIQTDDGRGGWAVEGVMDNGVYLPTLLPMPFPPAQ